VPKNALYISYNNFGPIIPINFVNSGKNSRNLHEIGFTVASRDGKSPRVAAKGHEASYNIVITFTGSKTNLILPRLFQRAPARLRVFLDWPLAFPVPGV
jgi:hypothetical protein